MADVNQNLWAPWRMEYIRSLGDEKREVGCFLCHYWSTPEQDAEHHVVLRGKTGLVVMNRFPYNNGHLLVACGEHKAGYDDLSDDELLDMQRLIRDGMRLLNRSLSPHGFNVGVNIGRCAGAGLPDHLHAHVVPRWHGDTNYMAVVGETRVIPDGLDALYRELIKGVPASASKGV